MGTSVVGGRPSAPDTRSALRVAPLRVDVTHLTDPTGRCGGSSGPDLDDPTDHGDTQRSIPSGTRDALPLRFGRLARELSADSSRALTPDRLVRLVVTVLGGAEHCALTLHRDGRLTHTLAATDAVARRLEQLQCSVGQGPSLDVATAGSAGPQVVVVDDLAQSAGAWPAFGAGCLAETGVRSLLSVPVDLGGADRATVTCYAARPHAFRPADVSTATLVAPFATASVRSVLDRQHADELRAALESSRQVGTAIGIVMARRLVTSERALRLLSDSAARRGVDVSVVAHEVAAVGDLPEGGAPTDPLRRPADASAG